jgi:putative ABC transport system substrate-binding protein
MNRRSFLGTLAGGLLAAPLAGAVEPVRIGVLSSDAEILSHLLKAFRDRLGELSYVDGQNLAIEYRFAEERLARLPDLAVELIGLGVGVIIAVGPAVLKAAKSTTATVPIVAIDFESDPVGAGFVASLARPGRNVTGTFLDQAELSGKWLQLLKETIPKLSRVAVFWDSSTPPPPYQLHAIKGVAESIAVDLQVLAIRGLDDFEGAFTAASKGHAQAMVILSSPLVFRSGARLANLAAARHLPTISMFRENATAGCLMAYGPSLLDGWRSLGSFAGRILKGTPPADLPVEQPTKFDLVINLKTAKALGLTIPPSLLQRADQVIE